MIEIIKIKKFNAPEDWTTKQINAVVRNSWLVVGRHWHDNIAPRHFEKGAAKKYGYKTRSGGAAGKGTKVYKRGYVARTIRQYKQHDIISREYIPLVKTGKSKIDLLARRRVIATATRNKSKVRITMSAGKFNFTSSRGIRMADEVRVVTRDENKEMSKMHDKEVAKGFGKIRTKTTTTIRG